MVIFIENETKINAKRVPNPSLHCPKCNHCSAVQYQSNGEQERKVPGEKCMNVAAIVARTAAGGSQARRGSARPARSTRTPVSKQEK